MTVKPALTPLTLGPEPFTGDDTDKEHPEGSWDRVEPWQFSKLRHYRRQNRRTARYLRSHGDEAVAARLELCGRLVGWKECAQGHRKGLWLWRCEKRGLCPICDGKHAKQLATRLQAYDGLLRKKPRTGYTWRALTLPVRTDGDIASAVDVALSAFSKLWKHRLGGRKKDEPVGAIRALEIAPQGNIHLHIGYYGPWIEQADLSTWWSEYTGGSYIVHVSKKGSFQRVATEVLKYAAKPAETPTEALVGFWKALGRRPRVRTYGSMRKDVLSRITGVDGGSIDNAVEGAEARVNACPECGDTHTLYITDTTLEPWFQSMEVGWFARGWHPLKGHTGRAPP